MKLKSGQFWAAKYEGNNGDLIVGRVVSVRTVGLVLIDNLITGKTSTKKASVLKRRNKRISKLQADQLVALYRRTKDRQLARTAAVKMLAWGEKEQLPLPTDIPPTIDSQPLTLVRKTYAALCREIDESHRDKLCWPGSAFVGVNWAEPRGPREAQALEIVQRAFPKHISVSVYELVDFVKNLLAAQEQEKNAEHSKEA